MRVRAVEVADRGEWLRMRGFLWPEAAEAEHAADIDAFLRGPSEAELVLAVFVCERAPGGLCGFLELSVRSYAEGCTGAAPYVEGWYVDPDVRGQGIGRALMEAAEQWARERGYTELASDAELENRASHEAHRALGFEEVERAVHFRKAL
ncbi:MAG: GNAT family N-acetyltransferase [Ardenticatenaceae bacterium]|nr:GNAT family N-acetyltransferase [Ardenticatenaceae bacterium]HBY98328.1 histone acetyltransferase [Chloroflexota bacterium]